MLQTEPFRHFNASQLHALDTRRNLAVRANAGSGKTSVLVERIVQLLARGWTEDPAQPSGLGSLAAITFTRKAAAELQERLRDSFRERIQATNDLPERDFWAERIEEIPRAAIGTIDSFCGRILREFGWLEGAADRIESDFEPLEEYDEQILKREAIDRIINRYSDSPTFGAGPEEQARAEACQWWASTQGYDALTRHLTRLLNHAVDPQLIVATHRALPPAAARVEEQWSALPAVRTLSADRDHLRDELRGLVETIQAARKPSDTLVKFRDMVLETLQWLEVGERAHEENALQALREALLTKDGSPRKAGLKLVQDRVLPLQDTWQPLLNGFTFDYGAELCALEAADRLTRLLEPAHAEYLQLCGQVNRFDYLTIARRTRDLLARSSRVRELARARWRYVMVDEFQDTNRLQWDIISWLVGAGPDGPLDADRLFVVGDPQQSIYRFRHADVSIFTRVEKQIQAANHQHGHADRPTDYDAARGEILSSPDQRLGSMPLAENYRSLSPMPLELLDHVFHHVFDPDAHGLDLIHNTFEIRYQKLMAGRRADPAKPGEVRYVIPRDPEIEDEAGEGEDAPPEEASPEENLEHRQVAAVVDQLAALHGQPKHTGQPGETLSWRDMAVLLPSRTVVLIALERELRRRGVPFVVTKGIGFWQRQEIRDAVNLAAWLADPGDELTLFAVLRGPLGLLTDTEILFLSQFGANSLGRGLRLLPLLDDDVPVLEVRPSGMEIARESHPLADHWERLADDVRAALTEVWHAFSTEVKDRLRATATRLAVWRRRVDRVAHADLLQGALEESGAFALYAAEVDGEVMLANLGRLFDIIRAEEARSAPGLARLTRKLRRQMDDSFKEEQASLAVGADALQVMTVHAAKGLEFPVVAVLKMERRADRASYARLMVVGEADVPLKEDALELSEPRPGTVAVCVRHPRKPRETYKPRLLKILHRLDVAQQVAESRRLFYVAATRAKERLILAGKQPRTLTKGGLAKLPPSWQKWFEEALRLTEDHKRTGRWEDPARGFKVAIITETPAGMPMIATVPAPPCERLALEAIHEEPKTFTILATALDEMRATWRRNPREWWLNYRAHVAMTPGRAGVASAEEFHQDPSHAIGTLVHRLARMGDALESLPARNLRELLETMAGNLLAAPSLDPATGEYRLTPVLPATVRQVVDATLRVLDRWRKEPAKDGEAGQLLAAAGETDVDFTLKLGRWLIAGRFDKLIATGEGYEIVSWGTASEAKTDAHPTLASLSALALYRTGKADLTQESVTVRAIHFPSWKTQTFPFTLRALETFAEDLKKELNAMAAFDPGAY